MKTLLILLFCLPAFAGFGGGRSSGGFSSGRSSSFGGSRSYSAPSRSYSSPSRSTFGGSRSSGSSATITRPSTPKSQYSGSQPTVQNHYYNNGGYGGGGGGFWSGWLWGSLFSHNNTPVVVTGGGAVDGQTVYVEQSHGFFYYLFQTILWVTVIFGVSWAIYWLVKE